MYVVTSSAQDKVLKAEIMFVKVYSVRLAEVECLSSLVSLIKTEVWNEGSTATLSCVKQSN